MPSKECVAEQGDRLSAEYGRLWDHAHLLALTASCGGMEDDIFCAAISRHIADTTLDDGKPVGSWPPRTAHLLRHAHDIEMERRRQVLNERGHPAAWDAQSDQTYQTLEKGQRPTWLRGQRCRSCSDTGMSRFYYDPRYLWRIWTYLEWRVLLVEQTMGMGVHSALCDCERGLSRSARQWTTRIPPTADQAKRYLTIPCLEQVRQIAESARRREALEGIAVGCEAPWLKPRVPVQQTKFIRNPAEPTYSREEAEEEIPI